MKASLVIFLVASMMFAGCTDIGEASLLRDENAELRQRYDELALNATRAITHAMNVHNQSWSNYWNLSDEYNSSARQLQSVRAELREAEAEIEDLRRQLQAASAKLNELQPLASTRFNDPAVFYDNSRLQAIEITDCTGGMFPTFDCDDILLAREARQSELDYGDIAIYSIPRTETRCEYAGQRVVHRIIDIIATHGGSTYEFAGDANAEPDDCYVKYAWIEAEVHAIVYDARL